MDGGTMINRAVNDPGRLWVYAFGVAHVQSFLLASPRLRDIQGGSQLLEDLCGSVFDKARLAAGLEEAMILSQAAAGARLLTTDQEAAKKLYAAWPMIAEGHAPGALIQQALISVEEVGGLVNALREVGEQLVAARVNPARSLPIVGPAVERYARTGEPAEFEQKVGESWERVDRSTHQKTKAWRALKTESKGEKLSELDRRFLGEAHQRTYRFAAGGSSGNEGLSSEDDPYVAVIHADGNAIGKFIQKLFTSLKGRDQDAEIGEVFKKFSEALAQATRQAANEAVQSALLRSADVESGEGAPDNQSPIEIDGPDTETTKLILARPIVLGGDDLTIITAADLAFDFIQSYLEAFERTTREHLGGLRVSDFDGLTACAGIAFTKEKFPFDRAHELAESLCGQAKRHAKSHAKCHDVVPSALTFHRVTSSLPEDAETVLAHELSGKNSILTLEAYRVGDRPAHGLPEFSALQALAQALPRDQQGGTRRLLSTLSRSPERADEAFERMCEVRNRRRPDKEPDALRQALERLTRNKVRPLWLVESNGLPRTPLLDAHVVSLTMVETEERG
jgi:hypothetical protein